MEDASWTPIGDLKYTISADTHLHMYSVLSVSAMLIYLETPYPYAQFARCIWWVSGYHKSIQIH